MIDITRIFNLQHFSFILEIKDVVRRASTVKLRSEVELESDTGGEELEQKKVILDAYFSDNDSEERIPILTTQILMIPIQRISILYDSDSNDTDTKDINSNDTESKDTDTNDTNSTDTDYGDLHSDDIYYKNSDTNCILIQGHKYK